MIKRSLLVAAIAATLSSVAYAESKVEVYGRLNLTLEHQNDGDSSHNVVQDNASRIGVRGQEQISPDLQAFFTLENGFNADTGTGKVENNQAMSFSRESYIGLRSQKFGQIRAGRIWSSVEATSADYVSLHNHDTGTSADALFGFGAVGATPIVPSINNNNTVAYLTPTFYGANLETAYSFAENTGNPGVTNIALNYDLNNLHLGGGYAKTKIKGGDGANSLYVVRALYTIGDFTFGGYYERDKFTDMDGDGSGFDAGTRNNFRLSAMYMLGNSEFHLNGGYAGKWSKIDESKATQYTIAYNYNLSKRTKVYAFYTGVKNGEGFAYQGIAGKTWSSFAVGLRHNF